MDEQTRHGLELFLTRLLSRSVLSDDERQAVLTLSGNVEHLRPHQDIVMPGDAIDHACLVVSGLTARFDQMRDGRRQIVAFYLPGDMCDLHSVPVSTAGWGLQALSPTTILRVAHHHLKQIIADHPPLGMAFWRDTVADASILAKALANIGRNRALGRLTHLFCEMGVRTQMSGGGRKEQYRLPVTQSQLADALGLTTVHVNRTLTRLRAEGIRFAGGEVDIEDWEKAVRIAEFDMAYLLFPQEP